MDEIYSDLENYNDVNALDELRNENTQLKFRLEEYASNMEKLQKDFDKLSSDFKTLEINYSSLLKTAKAEIERKTQIICNLNSEKDMMVLTSIQNTNKSILNIRRNLLRNQPHNYNLKTMKNDDFEGIKTNRKDLRDSKKFDFEKERKDETRVPSVDTVTSTEECVEKKLGKSNTYEKNSDTKDNITKNKSRAQSIRNRRKSMPVLGKQLPKLSSDEENYNSGNETMKKDRYSRDEKNRRNLDRNYNEKAMHKVSETSGIDEKYSSYHESSRETYYRGNSSRQSDKYRSIRDKYEHSQRLRRHFSPERSLRKPPRDHSNEYYQRLDYRRHRVLESPPPDAYEIQKRNRRFNYERENQYEDKHRSRYEKHSAPMKHKLLTDYEEPKSKRSRTHSYNKTFEDERIQNKHSTENAIPFKISNPLQLTSCLSPDYIDHETVAPVKEIMSTANIQLEDPRLQSQKYVVQNENDKVVLCTVTGRTVELRPIDSSTWNIKRVEVPEALKCSLHYRDELLQPMHQDVDKPVSIITSESGEIQSDNEMYDFVTDSYFNDIYEEERQRVRDLNIHNLYEKETKNVDSRKSRDSYNNVQSVNQTGDNNKQLDLPFTEYVIDHSKQDNKSDTKITIRLSKKETENSVKRRNRANENREPVQHAGEQRVLSCREIVEGDLALSDETSDNVDAQIKIKNKCRTRSQHITLEDKISKSTTAEIDTNTTNLVEISESKEHFTETTKKLKSKRKSHKSKENNAEPVRHTVEQQKSKKDMKAEHINEKFSDLFGDSSSLITPEDLGISAVPANKYESLFEDALDANDVNVKGIVQPQTESEIKSDEPTKIKEVVSQKPKKESEKKSDEFMVVKEVVSQKQKMESAKKADESVEVKEVISQKQKTKSDKKSDVSTEVKEAVSQKSKTKEKNKRPKKNEEKRSSIETKVGDKDTPTIKCQVVKNQLDIGSTVIISTGIKPQVPSEENVEPMVNGQSDLNVINEVNKVQHNEVSIKLQPLQPAAALATSTPYKEQPGKINYLEQELRMVESSCNSSDSRTLRNENGAPSDLSSNIDMSSQMETDAPDVRIFVKRRKKAVKKVST